LILECIDWQVEEVMRSRKNRRTQFAEIFRLLLLATLGIEFVLLSMIGLVSVLCPDPPTLLQARFVDRLWILALEVAEVGGSVLLGALITWRSTRKK